MPSLASGSSKRRKSHRWGSGTGRNSRFGTRSCLLFLVVPVEIYLTGAIENRISVPFAKIVPTPFHKGFYFRAGRGEYRSMYSYPGTQTNHPPNLPPTPPNSTHCTPAPHHTHHP